MLLDLDVTANPSVPDVLRELATLDETPKQQQLAVPTTSDEDCLSVASEFVRLAGSKQRLESAIGDAIRHSYDQVYDGQHTGRFHWAQLSKTEKTNAGSLVEIWLARGLALADGDVLDFRIAGHEVDCKFSQRTGGWMLPPEVRNRIAMLVTADDYLGTWSLGLVRVTTDRVNGSTNRDAKTTLNHAGRGAIHWLYRDAPLPPNTLLRIPARDAVAVMSRHRAGHQVSGQARLDELFRRAEGHRISRTVIATVAQQDDPMKRVRSNGGSRSRLGAGGYLLLGHYQTHRAVARDLALPVPKSGEIVSVRIHPAEHEHQGPATQIGPTLWRRWQHGDTAVAAPELPHVTVSAHTKSSGDEINS